MFKSILFTICLATASICTAQLDEIEKKLKSKPPTEETAIWLCDTAYTFTNNDPLLAQRIAELAKKKALEWNAELAIAKANHVIGISYWSRDLYEESIQYYLDALKYYEKVGNTRGVALIYMNVGNMYGDLKQHERSLEYLRKSLKPLFIIGDSVNLGKGFNNLGIVFKNLKQYDSAFYYNRKSIDVRKALKDSIGVASALNNIAVIYLDDSPDLNQEEAEIAYSYLMEVFNYLSPGDNEILLSKVYINLGKSLTKLGKYREAISYLDKGLELGEKTESLADQELAYNRFADLYKRMGNYKLALEYYQREVDFANKIRNENISKQIDELNIKYESEKKERQIAEMERQRAIERGIRNMLAIGVLATLIIAALIIFYVYQKRKKDKRISELEMQKLTDEINSKNKEIASYTMSFLQKNQLMEELKEQISELKKSSDLDTNKQLTRINRIVDNTFKSDEEWKTFQLTFDQMHDGFFRELKKEFSDISNAELKLCALLRLNMNLKESSKILGIAVDSVKTARYRLRKKLGLKTEDNLVDFLLRFEKENVE